MAYYQIQSLDDLKQVYADVQVVHVASEDVGQIVLDDAQQILLQNDGQQQVVYQTQQQQYQPPTAGAHYTILGEDITQQQSAQQQQQHPHQHTQHQVLLQQQQHNQVMEQQHQHATIQSYQIQQEAQHMQLTDHSIQHVQQAQQPQPPQIYYTTDQLVPSNAIAQQHTQHQHAHAPQQQQHHQQVQTQQHQKKVYIQQQSQPQTLQQQYQSPPPPLPSAAAAQHQMIHQQQSSSQQIMQDNQQQSVQLQHQVTTAAHHQQTLQQHSQQDQQQQIIYRMQPSQSPAQLQQQTHHLLGNTHVIVQQPSGQQVLIHQSQQQEIIMRQPMNQQRILYNNRVLYSTPQQTHQQQQHASQQTMLQQSIHQQQTQHQHIQLQTSPMHHTQTHLLQPVGTPSAPAPPSSPIQSPSPQLQQNIVYQQIHVQQQASNHLHKPLQVSIPHQTPPPPPPPPPSPHVQHTSTISSPSQIQSNLPQQQHQQQEQQQQQALPVLSQTTSTASGGITTLVRTNTTNMRGNSKAARGAGTVGGGNTAMISRMPNTAVMGRTEMKSTILAPAIASPPSPLHLFRARTRSNVHGFNSPRSRGMRGGRGGNAIGSTSPRNSTPVSTINSNTVQLQPPQSSQLQPQSSQSQQQPQLLTQTQQQQLLTQSTQQTLLHQQQQQQTPLSSQTQIHQQLQVQISPQQTQQQLHLMHSGTSAVQLHNQQHQIRIPSVAVSANSGSTVNSGGGINVTGIGTANLRFRPSLINANQQQQHNQQHNIQLQQHLGQSGVGTQLQTLGMARNATCSPISNVSAANNNIASGNSTVSSNGNGNFNGNNCGNNYELDLEDSIQAVFVKKDTIGKTMLSSSCIPLAVSNNVISSNSSGVGGNNTTVTTYYAAKDVDDNHHVIKNQNGTCITLAEYKKRNNGTQNNTNIGMKVLNASSSTVKISLPNSSGQATTLQTVPVARITPHKFQCNVVSQDAIITSGSQKIPNTNNQQSTVMSGSLMTSVSAPVSTCTSLTPSGSSLLSSFITTIASNTSSSIALKGSATPSTIPTMSIKTPLLAPPLSLSSSGPLVSSANISMTLPHQQQQLTNLSLNASQIVGNISTPSHLSINSPTISSTGIASPSSLGTASSRSPIGSTVTPSSVHQTSHNNYEIQTQHVLNNRSSQQMTEKDCNSAKMLVILVSGEQRLITFTLPRETCTVQDLLEQVGVPFDSKTTIQCVENPGANIDFVVTVGFSVQESASELISRAEQSLQMSRQQDSSIQASAHTTTANANTKTNTVSSHQTGTQFCGHHSTSNMATTNSSNTSNNSNNSNNVNSNNSFLTTSSVGSNVSCGGLNTFSKDNGLSTGLISSTGISSSGTSSGAILNSKLTQISTKVGDDQLIRSSQPSSTSLPTSMQTVGLLSTSCAASQSPQTLIHTTPLHTQRKVTYGYYTLCPNCGFSGYGSAKCERCKRTFLDSSKKITIKQHQGIIPITNIASVTTTSTLLNVISNNNNNEVTGLDVIPPGLSTPNSILNQQSYDRKRISTSTPATDIVLQQFNKTKNAIVYNNNTHVNSIGSNINSNIRGRINIGTAVTSAAATHIIRNTRGGARGTRRIQDIETVILTLSSDEEEDYDTDISASNGSNSGQGKFPSSPCVYKPLPFEANMPEIDEAALYNGFKRYNITELALSDMQDSLKVVSKKVRIGYVSFEPKDHVLITSKGVSIVAPNNVCRKSEDFLMYLHKIEMWRVLMSPWADGQKLYLCFYVTRECIRYIATHIDIYRDANLEESYKEHFYLRKILIELEPISEKEKNILKNIWSQVIEISTKEMRKLYDIFENELAAAAARQSGNSATAKRCNQQEIHSLLIYPPGKGGITITLDDYMCLATDQYLNDIIIDFYLKWLHINVISEKKKSRTFIFSTFFYKRLTTLSRSLSSGHDKEVKQTAAQKRHARVQNWTKNVNLFEKDYIVIPINEQSHWFLVIICFPGLKNPVTFDTNIPIKLPIENKKKTGNKKISLQIGNTTITPLTKRDNVPNTSNFYERVNDNDSERDEADGEDSDMTSDDSEIDLGLPNTTTTNVSSATFTATTSSNININANANNTSTNDKPAIKQPIILVFDSLAGTSRSRVVATLRDYLTCEYKAKMSHLPAYVFNKYNMPGHCVSVPQQDNFTDCGLYLLQYVEQFFKDPIRDYRMPIKQLVTWFETITVTRKREDITKLLRTLINEKNDTQKEISLPTIPLPTQNGVLVVNPESNEEYETDEGEDEEDYLDEEETDASQKMRLDQIDENGSDPNTVMTPSIKPIQECRVLLKRRSGVPNALHRDETVVTSAVGTSVSSSSPTSVMSPSGISVTSPSGTCAITSTVTSVTSSSSGLCRISTQVSESLSNILVTLSSPSLTNSSTTLSSSTSSLSTLSTPSSPSPLSSSSSTLLLTSSSLPMSDSLSVTSKTVPTSVLNTAIMEYTDSSENSSPQCKIRKLE